MKIPVKKFVAQGKYSGDIGFEYEPSADLCLIPLCKIDGKVRVFASYEIYDDDSVDINYTVKYRLTGQCSYCLKDTSKEVEKSFDVTFVPYGDADNYSYDGINIDLTTAVNDAILFSQPNVLLCRADCTGIDVNNK